MKGAAELWGSSTCCASWSLSLSSGWGCNRGSGSNTQGMGLCCCCSSVTVSSAGGVASIADPSFLCGSVAQQVGRGRMLILVCRILSKPKSPAWSNARDLGIARYSHENS